ncbi:MAG: hypothetical protein ACT6QS_03400 [Flavobacteriales bacterium]
MKAFVKPLSVLLICMALLATACTTSRKCDGSRARHTPMGKM